MMIRNFYITCFLSFITIGLFAQEVVVEDLDIAIKPAQIFGDFPYDHSIYNLKLEHKVLALFTQNGLVNQKGSTLAAYPVLNLIESGAMEGITTLQTLNLELIIRVKNVFTGQDIALFSKSIIGSARTNQAALSRAIAEIRPSDKKFQSFIAELNEKIDSYYAGACDEIITKAQKALEGNENEKALALMYSLPNGSDCLATNKNLLDNAYQKVQRSTCQQNINDAKVAILKKDYKDAIDALAKIDVASPCGEEAKGLLTKVGALVDEQTKKKLQFLNKVYSDQKELEKARQQNMKSISNTYIEGIQKGN